MSISFQAPIADSPATTGVERRVVGLDGLRGLMTIMVIVSHYFGEVRHGLKGLMFGWVAVNMFFVLSGYLIGKLILERRHHANFFAVFYARRFCRILPAYVITVVLLAVVIGRVASPWVDADVRFPLWSYLIFAQGFFMVGADSIGAHWLAPTWTLAVEEHFYLIIPAVIVFTPRRFLVPALLAAAAVAVGLRVAVFGFGFANPMLAAALLPAKFDVLVCGLLAAVAMVRGGVDWPRIMPVLRVLPLAVLVLTAAARLAGGPWFDMFSPLLVAAGSAAFVLCIVHRAPEGRRFDSRVLQFFGNNGYCLYLTHLPILGLMHGLILGTRPDLVTPAQWGVTVAALPVCVLVGWGLTKLVEEPLTRLGRTWRWSTRERGSLTPVRAQPTLSA